LWHSVFHPQISDGSSLIEQLHLRRTRPCWQQTSNVTKESQRHSSRG
jgi:hypothetical protein